MNAYSYGLTYVIGQAIKFLSYGFFFFFLFFLLFSSPNLSGRRLDVYHPSSTHGVALVRTKKSPKILSPSAHHNYVGLHLRAF